MISDKKFNYLWVKNFDEDVSFKIYKEKKTINTAKYIEFLQNALKFFKNEEIIGIKWMHDNAKHIIHTKQKLFE